MGAQHQFKRPGSTSTWKRRTVILGGKRFAPRSGWEYNVALILEYFRSNPRKAKWCGKAVADWQYEPGRFPFIGIKRGCVDYTPDFKVTFDDGTVEYWEVKGWMDRRSKTKLDRMERYHPEVKLCVIEARTYRHLEKAWGWLDGWWRGNK